MDVSPLQTAASQIAASESTSTSEISSDFETDVGRLAIPTDGAPVDWAGVTTDGYPYPDGQYSFEAVSYANDEIIGSAAVATYSTVSPNNYRT